ncbi:MAG: hypothetical protein HY258_10910 [Chloroflexi bacterium]|nr:hypothetical protein [Chloroflexota bacterium]
MNDLWARIIGGVLVLYAAFVIYRGRISISDDYSRSSEWLQRSEKPVQFWFAVGVILVIAALLIFNVFHF